MILIKCKSALMDSVNTTNTGMSQSWQQIIIPIINLLHSRIMRRDRYLLLLMVMILNIECKCENMEKLDPTEDTEQCDMGHLFTLAGCLVATIQHIKLGPESRNICLDSVSNQV